jgi:DNA invertase Pin-like site-specific DNA recombinase
MTIYGYARVSTEGQDLAPQLDLSKLVPDPMT